MITMNWVAKTVLFLLVSASVILAYFFYISPSNNNVFIIDDALLLSPDDEMHIGRYHNMLLDEYKIDYRVITVKEKVDIDLYALDEFERLKVGENSESLRGLLLVIDTYSDRVRLEVSTNLEPVFTDVFISYIERRQMIPFFNVGRVGDGIFATSELIRIRAEDAKNGREFDDTKLAGSTGGGAKNNAGIGVGKTITSSEEDASNVYAADNPEETLRRYFVALSQNNPRADLDVFTPETQEFMSGLVRTVAQSDNTFRRYQRCEIDRIVYNHDETLAVLLHDLSNRACDPFTLQKGNDGKWRLDLKAIGLGLGHTYGNIWYVDYSRQEVSSIWKYDFGFRDFRFKRPNGEQFDHQGIPYYRPWGFRASHVYEGSTIYKTYGEGTPIYDAGLRKGDVIVSWAGIEQPHSWSVANRMKRGREGLDVVIKYRRDDKYLHTIMKVPPVAEPGKLRWGARYNSNGPPTPIVHYVTPESVASELGLKQGDIIVRWNAIEQPEWKDIYQQIKAAKSGDAVNVDVLRNDSVLLLSGVVKAPRKMSEVK